MVTKAHIQKIVSDFSGTYNIRLREGKNGALFLSCYSRDAIKAIVLRYDPVDNQPGMYHNAVVTSPATR